MLFITMAVYFSPSSTFVNWHVEGKCNSSACVHILGWTDNVHGNTPGAIFIPVFTATSKDCSLTVM